MRRLTLKNGGPAFVQAHQITYLHSTRLFQVMINQGTLGHLILLDTIRSLLFPKSPCHRRWRQLKRYVVVMRG